MWSILKSALHYLRLVLFFFILLFTGALFSQTTIVGKVVDSSTQEEIYGASVLLQQQDLARGSITDTSGSFTYTNLSPGDYKITVVMIGYRKFEQVVSTLNDSLAYVNFELVEDVELLDEAVVNVVIRRAQMNGDTLEFNPNAYKVNQDADAGQLVEKMPGVVMNNGKIQVNGEDVNEVLVDGKPFFGGDPNAVLKTMPAEVIKRIQVYDKETDEAQATGFSSGNTSKTINIVLKDEFKNGTFGKVYAGYGNANKYNAGGNVNQFKGNRRMTIVGQTNNVNIQNFSTEDLLGVVGEQSSGKGGGPGRGRGRGRGRRGGGRGGVSGDEDDFMVSQQGGISTTHAVGVNYQNSWNDKLELVGSYFFNYSDNTNRSFARQSFFNPQQVYEQTDTTNSINSNHKINLRIKYDLSDKDMILFRPSITTQYNQGQTVTSGRNYLSDSLLNNINNELNPELFGIDWSGHLIYRHNFKKGRSLTTTLEINNSNKQGESTLLYQDLNADGTLSDSLNQYSELDNKTYDYKVGARYSEPITDSSGMMFSYDYSIEPAESDKYTYNYPNLTNSYTELDTTLSNVFTNLYETHSGGLAYHQRRKKNMLMLRLNYQYASLFTEQDFPRTLEDQVGFHSIIPMLVARTSLSDSKKLMFVYRGSTRKPGIAQLQEVVDNTNPLRLVIGNSDLKQQYDHRVIVRYNSLNLEKNHTFFAGGILGYTSNYIANTQFTAISDTSINNVNLQRGEQLTSYKNLEGNFSATSFASYGTPVEFLKSNLNANLSVNYQRLPAETNGNYYRTHNEAISLGLVLGSNISKNIDFTINSNSSINLTQGGLSTGQSNQYFIQNSNVRLHLRNNKGYLFEGTYNHQLYAGFDSAIDQQFSLLSLAVGKKVFKNQRGEIKFLIYDVLNQNNSNSLNTYSTYIEETSSLVLNRYYMVTFTYDLRFFKNNEKKLEEQN